MPLALPQKKDVDEGERPHFCSVSTRILFGLHCWFDDDGREPTTPRDANPCQAQASGRCLRSLQICHSHGHSDPALRHTSHTSRRDSGSGAAKKLKSAPGQTDRPNWGWVTSGTS